jgi:hypothetical protein
MNVFIGVGKINNINLNGRILKFNLAIKQEKPCNVPCVLFDPDEETKAKVAQFEISKRIVWLKGRASTYEFEIRGKPICKLEIVTYPGSIKPI